MNRRSISGGCAMLGRACLETWACLQQAVALSSAESELYGWVEGITVGLGFRCAVPHVFCASEAAVNIRKMEGLRRLRHIDLRSCYAQHAVQAESVRISPVKGSENHVDIFRKNLDMPATLRHLKRLGLQETPLEGGGHTANALLRPCLVTLRKSNP